MKVRKRRRLSRRARRLGFYLTLAVVGGTLVGLLRPSPSVAGQGQTAPSPTILEPAAVFEHDSDQLRCERLRIQRDQAELQRDLGAIADLVPSVYRREVVQAAREFGLNPRLLAAQASTENAAWDPFLVGEYGEIGLLQVMPSTQEEVVALGLVEWCDLTDPLCNLRTGAAYLAVAIERAGGTAEGLRYYNGGPMWAEVPATAEYAIKVFKRMLFGLEQE